jgi:hypothetical protein
MRHVARAVAALFVLAAAVRAGEEKVPLDKLPKAVVEAVKKRFPKAELKGASKEKEGDKTAYEVSVKEAGKNVDVTLTPEGEITLIEKEIAFKDLPKAVAAAYEAKYPKATYKIVEEVIQVKGGKETLGYYEALLVTADKKTLEIEMTPDGKVKNVEEKTGKSD